MKTCPHCGAAMEDNALFCTSCGTQWSSAGAGAPNGYGNPDQATYNLTPVLSRTEYADGTKVYVNYGFSDAQADGITVPARDYLVVR